MKNHRQYRIPTPTPPESPSLQRIERDLDIINRMEVNDVEINNKVGRRIKLTGIVSGALTTTIVRNRDFLVTVEDLAVTRNIELPDAKRAGRGKVFGIKDVVGGAATTTITISAIEGQTIEGALSTTLSTNYEQKSFFSDGSNWFVM